MPVKEKNPSKSTVWLYAISFCICKTSPRRAERPDFPMGPHTGNSADRRPAITGPLLCLQFLQKWIHYEGCDSIRGVSSGCQGISPLCALEFVVLSCILLSDSRRTDSDRKWSWHWLRVQELQDKLPLFMSWLQQPIILHAVMEGIHLWRLFTHLGGDRWAHEAVLEDFNFCYW